VQSKKKSFKKIKTKLKTQNKENQKENINFCFFWLGNRKVKKKAEGSGG